MPVFKYTVATRRMPSRCEHCARQFEINAIGVAEGWRGGAGSRASRDAERSVPGYACPHCGLLPKRPARLHGLVLSGLLWLIPAGFGLMPIIGLAANLGPRVALQGGAVTLLLFLLLWGAYHRMLPQGIDFNAPGVARWRLEGRLTDSDGVVVAKKGINATVRLLTTISLLSLWVASICAPLTVQKTGLILPLLALAGVFLAGVAGIRRALYPRLQNDRDVRLLKDQATYRATYSRLSSAELEDLLKQPSDLIPSAAKLIKEELTRRQNLGDLM